MKAKPLVNVFLLYGYNASDNCRTLHWLVFYRYSTFSPFSAHWIRLAGIDLLVYLVACVAATVGRWLAF